MAAQTKPVSVTQQELIQTLRDYVTGNEKDPNVLRDLLCILDVLENPIITYAVTPTGKGDHGWCCAIC